MMLYFDKDVLAGTDQGDEKGAGVPLRLGLDIM